MSTTLAVQIQKMLELGLSIGFAHKKNDEYTCNILTSDSSVDIVIETGSLVELWEAVGLLTIESMELIILRYLPLYIRYKHGEISYRGTISRRRYNDKSITLGDAIEELLA